MKRILFFLLACMLFTGTRAQSPETIQDSTENSIVARATEPELKELTQKDKDSIILSRLNASQLLELKRYEIELEKQKVNARSKEEMPLNGLGIFMLSLLPFVFVVILVIISNKQKSAESKRKYDLYMKSLEMGQNIPEHFFEEPKPVKRSSNLKNGIILLMIGLAFGLFAIISHKTNTFILLLAIIPGFVGTGYLLINKLEKPKTEIPDSKDEQV